MDGKFLRQNHTAAEPQASAGFARVEDRALNLHSRPQDRDGLLFDVAPMRGPVLACCSDLHTPFLNLNPDSEVKRRLQTGGIAQEPINHPTIAPARFQTI